MVLKNGSPLGSMAPYGIHGIIAGILVTYVELER